MMHADDADLALAASGAGASPELERHLETCPTCRAAVDDWRRILDDPSAEEVPPEHVWRDIHRELGLSGSPDDPLRPAEPAAGAPLSTIGRRSRSRRSAWVLAAAAVAIAAVGVAAGLAIAGLDRAPKATVVAQAALDPLPGWSKDGEATLEDDGQGNRILVVDLPGTVSDGTVREVWLIRSDLSGLVSLGLLAGDSGRFTLPSDLDVTEFDVVDVSAEPLDGDPAHSGDSIVRGVLRTV